MLVGVKKIRYISAVSPVETSIAATSDWAAGQRSPPTHTRTHRHTHTSSKRERNPASDSIFGHVPPPPLTDHLESARAKDVKINPARVIYNNLIIPSKQLPQSWITTTSRWPPAFDGTTPRLDALGATEFWTPLAGVAFYDLVISVFMAAGRSADGLCKLVTLRASFQASRGEEKSSVTAAAAWAEAECPLLESLGSCTAQEQWWPARTPADHGTHSDKTSVVPINLLPHPQE